MVEACVASHCHRLGKAFYYKGEGEVDVIWLKEKTIHAVEVKWSKQLRPADLKTLKQFKNSTILGKIPEPGKIETIHYIPVYQYLNELFD